MELKIITVKGHLLGGKLFCNLGILRPKNADKFQNNIKGYFKLDSNLTYIVEYVQISKYLI